MSFSRGVLGPADHGMQPVQWLSTCEPPVELATHLRIRGIALQVGPQGLPAAARLMLVETGTGPILRTPNLYGRRVAVLHPDPGSADALAQALRGQGAEVVALSLNPEALDRVEALDPDVVIVEPRDFCGSCWEIVRALWRHPRLRFAAILLAAAERGIDGSSSLDMQQLCAAICRASADYVRVQKEAREHDEIELPLSMLGPARTLRALLESKRSLRARFACPELTLEVDIAEEIVVGARGGPGASLGDALLGPDAVAALLTQHEGNVHVRTVEHPSVTNIMAPVEAAFHAARESLLPNRPSGVQFAPVSASTVAPRTTPRDGWVAAPVKAVTPLRRPAAIETNARSAHPDVGAAERAARTPIAVEHTGGLDDKPAPVPRLPKHTLDLAQKPKPAAARAEPAKPPAPPPKDAALPVASAHVAAPVREVPSPVLVVPVVPAMPPANTQTGVSAAPELPTRPPMVAEPRPRSAIPTGSIPIDANELDVGARSSARVVARVDQVVTKRSTAPKATTRIGMPAPSVVRADGGRVVAVASVAPRAAHALSLDAVVSEREVVPEPKRPSLLDADLFSEAETASHAPLQAPLAPNVAALAPEPDLADASPELAEPFSEAHTSRRAWLRRSVLVAAPILAALAWLTWRSSAHVEEVRAPESPRVAMAAPSAPAATPSAPAAAAIPAPTEVAPAAERETAEAIDEEDDDHDDGNDVAEGESRKARARRASKLVSQGHGFRRQGLFPTARSRYHDALREYPGYPRALAGLAQLAIETRDPTQAIGFARQAVKARPTQNEYLLLLGDAYDAAGKRAEARDAWQTAAKRGSRAARERLR